MSKITKRQLHNGWHGHDTEIIKMKKELRELKQSVLRLEKLTDEKLLDKPQLKQLDQSIFDGLDEKWRWAAFNTPSNSPILFSVRPQESMYGKWYAVLDCDEYMTLDELEGVYEYTDDWKNSLIERDTAKELTGSDLCRAMLERGDKYVMCQCWNSSYADIEQVVDIVSGFAFEEDKKAFAGVSHNWDYAVPINNQGEPLTAAEAGL